MYNYVFHFNEFTNLWNAIPRDVYNEYWSDKKVKGVLSSKQIDVLIGLVNKLEKDQNFIKKLENECV